MEATGQVVDPPGSTNRARRLRASAVRFNGHGEFFSSAQTRSYSWMSIRAFNPASSPKDACAHRFVVDGPGAGGHLAAR